ncbi:hypothetical protein DFS34DRAFT_592716 [Phlyctochytrium arcticum]|nr:hypothetical protein DFS34DRAFT_592716 [Phlyctochytrium arcticum]
MSFEKRKKTAKTSLEQYYTKKELIDSIVTDELVQLHIKNNIEWFIASSGADGSLEFKLRKILPNITYVLYDLYPPDDTYSSVIVKDFLQTTNEPNMKNIAIGFNLPYGVLCKLSIEFIRHAVKIYDPSLICMILPHAATCARYDGFKLSYRRLVPAKSFYKFGTNKVFNYDAFWSIFETGKPSPIQKLDTCIPEYGILGIHVLKTRSMLSKNILLIGRYYRQFRWYWLTDSKFDHIPSHIDYIAIYLEEGVGEEQVNKIAAKIMEYRKDVVFYKRSICIQDVVRSME